VNALLAANAAPPGASTPRAAFAATASSLARRASPMQSSNIGTHCLL
jgi:hypothetical protein